MKNQKAKPTFANRIFWTVLPWMIVILLAFSGIFFFIQAREFQRDKEKSVQALISGRAVFFDEHFTEIKSKLLHISSLSSVRSALRSFQDMDAVEQYRLRNEIRGTVDTINIFNPYVEDMIVIGTNGFVQNLSSSRSLKAHTDPLEWSSIRGYTADKGNFHYTIPYEADYYAVEPHMVLSVVLPVYDSLEQIGFVQCNLNYGKVLDLLRPESEDENFGSDFLAVNTDGKIVISADPQRIGTDIDPSLTEQVVRENGIFTVRDGGYHMVVYRQLPVTDWIFMEWVPYGTMLRPVFREAVILLGILLPLSMVIMAAALGFLSRRLQKPMAALRERVETADIENYERPGTDYKVEEVQVVADRFEDAMEKTRALIRDVYEEELLRKNAQLETLRNQITPHFLYNSLQLIKAEAILSGNAETGRTVTSLANLLRYSMNSQEETATVKAELAYVRDFLEIYRKRYVDKFSYEIKADERADELRIPKMILQPFAENSIKHGIQGMTGGGRIEVSSLLKDGLCEFTIRDNGAGAGEERLRAIRAELMEDGPADLLGIGIKNVHERVRLMCGPDSGITEIDAREGQYFLVRLSVRPLSDDRDSDDSRTSG